MAIPRLLTFAALLVFASSATAVAEEPLQYNRDIRPLLADYCFACHGPDSAAREADLRLDQREAAIEMGAITPHNPDESEMIRRILTEDPDELMPPPATKKKLSASQREQLVRWIQEGAKYELHWSFIPPRRPELPDLEKLGRELGLAADELLRVKSWPRTPIDHFLLARMLPAGLRPAPEADRRTLARRLSLDLTGLPPTPKMVEDFVNDRADNAYEKLVDQLLASKHWGEHRGRYWLDYARYADTHGIHFDNYREMWTYRDWVINAFNQNMSFDQFTIENLAGDLLPNATLSQQIASGFNRCNMTTNEGGIIDEEYLVLYARDRTETTSQVWLGLTAGCAVCHSHKFDPLSQREFYEMAAFFNNTTQGARDGNIKNTPPVIPVPLAADRQRFQQLFTLIPQAEQDLDQRRQQARTDFKKWLAEATVESLSSAAPRDSLYLQAPMNEGGGETIRVDVAGKPRSVELARQASWRDGPSTKALQVQGAACELADAGDFGKEQAFTCAAWIHLPASDGYGAICARMDSAPKYRGWDFWTQRRQIGMHLISAWPENGLKVVGREQVPANQWVHVAVSYDGSGRAAGVKIYYDGQPQATNTENDTLNGPTQTDVAFRIGQRSGGEPFSGGLQDLRVYQRALTPSEVESLARLSRFAGYLEKPAPQRSQKEEDELYGFWLGAFDTSYRSQRDHLAQLQLERGGILGRGTIAHVMQEKDEAATAYVLNRGEYDKRGDQVAAGTPAVLPKMPAEYPRNRLGFAKWLVLPDHPLTARVTVNRFWQQVFGAGIVKTSGDFGVMGQLPTHPQLLDWLAIEFREKGWDVKQFFKLMVMSAAYRQQAVVTPEKLEKDPENRFLARGPRFRMDGEMVRDYALAVSGLLAPQIGGPSVKPYQPAGVWEAIAMNVSNTRSYQPGAGDDLYRRSVYTFIKRMAPPASMEIFNAPNREVCLVQRERTNTPLQALVTLNDEQFVEAARHLAQRALQEGGDQFTGRLNSLSLRLLARQFRPQETRLIQASLHDLLEYYQAHPEDAKKLLAVGQSAAEPELDAATLAAWTMLANQLMNLDEVLTK